MNTQHPLLGKFDADPGQWRPFWYGLEIDVPCAVNGKGSGSVNLNNQPFILTRITHQIIGCIESLEEPTGLFQDGMYTIGWKDEISVYQNQPLPAELFMGSVRTGFSYEFPYPVPYAGNKTLTFEVYNRCQRTLSSQATTFKVGIVLHGVANWGVVLQK